MNFPGNVFWQARVGGNMRIGSRRKWKEAPGGGNPETFPCTGRINLEAAAAEMGIDR
jgi:hypothetical protein